MCQTFLLFFFNFSFQVSNCWCMNKQHQKNNGFCVILFHKGVHNHYCYYYGCPFHRSFVIYVKMTKICRVFKQFLLGLTREVTQHRNFFLILFYIDSIYSYYIDQVVHWYMVHILYVIFVSILNLFLIDKGLSLTTN